MPISTEGGGAKLHLKRLSHGHCGKLFVSGQRYTHIFEDFKRRNVTGFSSGTNRKCHPELRIFGRVKLSETREVQGNGQFSGTSWVLLSFCLLFLSAKEKVSSGSCQRYIIPTKEKINNISSASNTAKRYVRGDFVPQKESETGWLPKQLCHPELGSGSYQQYIIPTKGNNNNITSTFRTAKRQVRGGCATHKAAFTLAEVLITLGIIGVVAAMTLPTLLQNYQKKVTAVRLKHFSSLIQQASQTYNAQAMIKTVDSLDYITPNDPNSMMDYFNIYFKPYIKVNEVEKKEAGILIKFANGTGAYLQKINDCPLEPDNLTCETYFIFCPNIKYCENINEAATSTSTFNIDGKNSFIMYTSGNPPAEYRVNKWSRETLIEAAKDSPYYCSSLIEFDNWEIKDDNPCWK